MAFHRRNIEGPCHTEQTQGSICISTGQTTTQTGFHVLLLFGISDDYSPGSPVVLFGILPHEHKMSVLNLVIKKGADVTRPIKSKERLIFHIGFRRFSACPIFSQHTVGKKHKVL